MKAQPIITYPSNINQFEAIQAFMNALKIKFEIATKDKSQTQEFVEVPEWHKTIVRERIKNSKPEDFTPWEIAKKQINTKYGI
jgi:hypothetical protein